MTAFLLAADEKVPEIGRKRLIPFFKRGFLGGGILVNARVVEGDVELAKVIEHLPNHDFHALGIRHIGCDWKGLNVRFIK